MLQARQRQLSKLYGKGICGLMRGVCEEAYVGELVYDSSCGDIMECCEPFTWSWAGEEDPHFVDARLENGTLV